MGTQETFTDRSVNHLFQLFKVLIFLAAATT